MDLPIPETQDDEALTRQDGVPDGVVILAFGGLVRGPIHLNDYLGRVADEIEDIAAERRLATEVEAMPAQVLEGAPQAGF
jgi:hypothetical protein